MYNSFSLGKKHFLKSLVYVFFLPHCFLNNICSRIRNNWMEVLFKWWLFYAPTTHLGFIFVKFLWNPCPWISFVLIYFKCMSCELSASCAVCATSQAPCPQTLPLELSTQINPSFSKLLWVMVLCHSPRKAMTSPPPSLVSSLFLICLICVLVHSCFLPMYMCAMCVPCACEVQKQQVLGTAVNHRVGAGNHRVGAGNHLPPQSP